MQSSALPLNFTTFYSCGIKPFTTISQRNCVNLLLKGVHPTSDNSFDVLSDSVCSNYAKGKKSIKDELRVELLNLQNAELVRRIDSVGIQDPAQVSAALKRLIEHSGLRSRTKNSLLKNYDSENPLAFIAQVFNQAVRSTDARPLTDTEQEILESCIHGDISSSEGDDPQDMPSTAKISARSDSSPAPSVSQLMESRDEDEEYEWMQDYLPATFASDSTSFAMTPVQLTNSPVNMPLDYRALIATLKPALTGDTLQTFSFADFISAMSIDEHNGNVLQGSLSNWVMCGSLKSICAAIDRIDFSKVSDFAIQLIGMFTLQEADAITATLRHATNSNVNILSALIYVKDAPELELRIISHLCPEKVKDQQLMSTEDIRIYDRKKK